MLYQYILTQITLMLHFQSSMITLATPTRLLLTLVRRLANSIQPLCGPLDSQATQARLASTYQVYTSIYWYPLSTSWYVPVCIQYIQVYTCTSWNITIARHSMD